MRQMLPLVEHKSPSDDGLSASAGTGTNLFSMHEQDSGTSHVVTEEDLRLLAEWPVPDLISLLNNPEESIERYADDYVLFHERAGRIYEALTGSIQPRLLKLRFGVDGLSYDYAEPFQLSQKFLDHLWKDERPVAHWKRQERDELNQVALLGRSYALADSALNMQQMSGMSRIEAIENGCYGAYLRQIYLRAFNLYGLVPLNSNELGVQGVDPWSQVAVREVSLTACNGQQLLRYAQRLFRDYQISFETFSIMRGVPYTVSVAERIKPTNWIAVIQNAISSCWLKGESAALYENALAELAALDRGAEANQYQLA